MEGRWKRLHRLILNYLGEGDQREDEVREELQSEFTKQEIGNFFWLTREKWEEFHG